MSVYFLRQPPDIIVKRCEPSHPGAYVILLVHPCLPGIEVTVLAFHDPDVHLSKAFVENALLDGLGHFLGGVPTVQLVLAAFDQLEADIGSVRFQSIMAQIIYSNGERLAELVLDYDYSEYEWARMLRIANYLRAHFSAPDAPAWLRKFDELPALDCTIPREVSWAPPGYYEYLERRFAGMSDDDDAYYLIKDRIAFLKNFEVIVIKLAPKELFTIRPEICGEPGDVVLGVPQYVRDFIQTTPSSPSQALSTTILSDISLECPACVCVLHATVEFLREICAMFSDMSYVSDIAGWLAARLTEELFGPVCCNNSALRLARYLLRVWHAEASLASRLPCRVPLSNLPRIRRMTAQALNSDQCYVCQGVWEDCVIICAQGHVACLSCGPELSACPCGGQPRWPAASDYVLSDHLDINPPDSANDDDANEDDSDEDDSDEDDDDSDDSDDESPDITESDSDTWNSLPDDEDQFSAADNPIIFVLAGPSGVAGDAGVTFVVIGNLN